MSPGKLCQSRVPRFDLKRHFPLHYIRRSKEQYVAILQSNGQHSPLRKVSTSFFGDTGYDELIRRIRRRERNGSSCFGELEVCHGCPFGKVAIKRLPYLDLFP
jgi:hypothetical protein